MNLQINNDLLNIIFHQVRSETLYENILSCQEAKINSKFIDKMLFQSLSRQIKRPLTNDEFENIRLYGENQLKTIDENSSLNLNNFFGLLVNSAEKMIKIQNNEPVCKFEFMLEFREISKILGQDIFTTSLMAKYDLDYNYESMNFTWPVTMHSDNLRLRQILKRGISENHFHLNGSVPVFFLSWVSIMNHPQKIRTFFNDNYIKEKMEYNLYSKKISTDKERIITLKEKLYLASYIRGILFKKVVLKNDVDIFEKLIEYENEIRKSNLVSTLIENLRYQFGYKFKVVNGQKKVLDYAININNIAKALNIDDSHHNRMLNGERSFLYECFKSCFSGNLSQKEQDILYLYLVI